VGLDETLVALRAFGADLDALSEAMAASLLALRAEHEQVSALWQDEFSRAYRLRWEGLEQGLEDYLGAQAPRYQAFLASRIAHLGRYLGDE